MLLSVLKAGRQKWFHHQHMNTTAFTSNLESRWVWILLVLTVLTLAAAVFVNWWEQVLHGKKRQITVFHFAAW